MNNYSFEMSVSQISDYFYFDGSGAKLQFSNFLFRKSVIKTLPTTEYTKSLCKE